jgi:hypothetical protein
LEQDEAVPANHLTEFLLRHAMDQGFTPVCAFEALMHLASSLPDVGEIVAEFPFPEDA